MQRFDTLRMGLCRSILILAGMSGILLIAALATSATQLSQEDSLYVFVAGDALVTYQEPSGYKGEENGFLRAVLDHAIVDNWYATVGIRGYNALPEPYLETGALSWRDSTLQLSGGYLTSRYGICEYYKPWSTYSPLFENPIIWDDYGFGESMAWHSGYAVLQECALMNSRENGSVNAFAGIETPSFRAGFLGGFQTYSLEDQDNNVTLGFESSAGSDAIMLHTALCFERNLGYSLYSQTAVVPGNRFNGFLEMELVPCRSFIADLLGIYRRTTLYYNQMQVFTGVDCRWFLGRIWGVGGGAESLDDLGIVTWTPGLRVFLAPAPDPTSQLSVGIERTWTGSSSPLYELTGNVCVTF